MALLRLPSLQKFFDNPALIEQYPLPIGQRIVEQLTKAVQIALGATSLPDNPVDMALQNPRYKWMDARHIRFLGEKVASTIESCGSLIVTMPPQHAKSSTCSIWTPVWKLASDPEAQILFVSYEKTFATRWGKKVRDLIAMYGHDYGLELDPRSLRADDWQLTSGGGMSCTGVGGSISGRYPKLVIVDDAIKNWEEAQSDTIREGLWDWWEGTLEQRLQPDTALIVIGTRYREDDLIGRIVKKAASVQGSRQYEVVSLPAIAEAGDVLGREPGSGLWLESKPQKWYESTKATSSPAVWSAVHQQHPSPPGGNMVDPEWWGYYTPAQLPGAFDQEVQSWDLALDSKNKTDSYQAGVVVSRKGALVYVRDGWRNHCDINGVITQLKLWAKVYPSAKQKLVERSLAGPALAATLRHEVSGVLAWPPKGTQKSSKETCLNACIPDIRSKNVMLPMHPDGSKPKWVQEFVEELRQFPYGSHDDWVDAFSQAIGFVLPSARVALGKMGREAEAESAQSRDSPEQAHTKLLHAMVNKLGKEKLEEMRRGGVLQGPGAGARTGIGTNSFVIGGSRFGARRRTLC